MPAPPPPASPRPAEPSRQPPPAIRVLWPETPPPPVGIPCPNCGAAGPKDHLLDVAWTAPKLPKGDRKPVLACPACTARFYPPLKVPNYHDPDVMGWGWHQFHIQHGAGLVAITRLLGRIDRPPGTTCLEIGCGYGFGLDFARHALRWRCAGIDPSPMARLGAADLGLDIADGYFPDDLRDNRKYDVIAATEVIEHVQNPAALLAALRARLEDNGILLLTTPDGAAIERTTPDADLVQLLAPGIHMVFQTAQSLRRLLHETGFADIDVRTEGLTLVAYAAPREATLETVLSDDDAAQRPRFRAWLAGRAHDLSLDTDPGLGFAARAMFEAAIDGDWPAARVIRALLFPALRKRYGIDPDSLETLPDAWTTLPLSRLKDDMPLNLGMILYAEASRLRADPALRPRAGAMFTLAGHAADALHAALARLALNDGLAGELRWRGPAEAAIEAARLGAPETPERFAALAALSTPEAARAETAWRGVIELVNAGRTDLARALMDAQSLAEPGPDLPAGTRRDALIVLGQLALEPGADPLRAVEIATDLGDDDPEAAPLLLGAIVRLVNEARHEPVAKLIERAIPLAAARDDALGTDAANALAIVIEKTADPAVIPALLRPLALDRARRVAIVLGAFSRLVAAGRHDEAVTMTDEENIVSHAVARDDDAGHNARLALALLDLATGDPLDIPSRLAGLAIDEQRRRDFLIGAFSRLVNAARYRDATGFAAEAGIEALAGTGGATDPAGNDALTGLAILDLVTGDPALAPARIRNIPIDAARRRQITLGAFVGLVNRSRYAEATTLRESAPIVEWAAIADEDGRDAAIALIALALINEDPATLPALLDRLPDLAPALRADALVQAALRLIHLNRADEAGAILAAVDPETLPEAGRADLLAAEAGLAAAARDIEHLVPLLARLDAAAADPARIAVLAAGCFTAAVSEGDFAGASLLRARIEPAFADHAPATTDLLRGAGFALGVLELQEPAAPHRAERAFAAVRQGFAARLAEGETAPALFWESVRGEAIALHRTGRADEAASLCRAMRSRYEGAPDDLEGSTDMPAP